MHRTDRVCLDVRQRRCPKTGDFVYRKVEEFRKAEQDANDRWVSLKQGRFFKKNRIRLDDVCRLDRLKSENISKSIVCLVSDPVLHQTLAHL